MGTLTNSNARTHIRIVHMEHAGKASNTNNPRIPHCIVFDLFHTLVDPEDFRPKEFRRAERVASLLQIDPEAFSSYWSKTLAIRNSRSTPIITLVEEYLSKIGKNCSPQILSQIDYELGRYQDLAILNPRPQVVSALKSLKRQGFKLGVLANCDEREARRWSISPISSYFETVCFSYDIGYQKPEREAYQIVLKKLRASASQAVYVGDGGNNELEGARAVGFSLIVFMKEFVSRNGLRNAAELETFERRADVSVDAFEKLPHILSQRYRNEDLS